MHTAATGPAAAKLQGKLGMQREGHSSPDKAIKVAQAGGGQGSEAASKGKGSCSSAQQARPPVDISASKGRAKSLRRSPGAQPGLT